MEGFSVDSLILACTVISAEYGIPKKIMLEASGNFVSEKFKEFCRRLNVEQAVSLSYHHHSNAQVEACTKVVK